MRINYKAFIEDNILIINKKGDIVPFIFNDTQNYYWNLLTHDYPTLQGIRENILKFRQPGFSSLIDAIFTVDFIMSLLGKQSITYSDIYSHKDEETKTLFNRVSFFFNSWIAKSNNLDVKRDLGNVEKIRRSLLREDSTNKMTSRDGSEINVRTANAKVSGRGGTKQNMHFSEPAFYPNTDVLNANDLVLGAEQQVADGVGKIFRESTGNMIGDFFNEEYEFGKQPGAKFKSRFLGWWLHKEYSLTHPADWQPSEKYDKLINEFKVPLEQVYWHHHKIMSSKPQDREKTAREYPCDDIEAFLQQGKLYFLVDSLKRYKDGMKTAPIKEMYAYV